MKNKTILKLILCFLIIGLMIPTPQVFAEDNFPETAVTSEYFFGASKDEDVKNIVNDLDLGMIMHIQSLIMYIGTIAAVIVILIYAIQWMMAAPSRKQELKSGLCPLVIGVILLVLGPKLAFFIMSVFL